MKIVVNKCFGGYSLSTKATSKYYELKGIKAYHFSEDYNSDYKNRKYIPFEGKDGFFIHTFSVPNPNDFEEKELWKNYFLTNRPDDRTDPLLIQAIEEIGEKESSGSCASLEIIEIPDDVKWQIDEYDGIESIHEQHRSW